MVAARLRETGAGTVVTTSEAVGPVLARPVDVWRRSVPPVAVLPDELARHTRRASPARLAFLPDRVVEGARPGAGAARATMAAGV